MELQLLVLTPDEKVLGFLNPDLVDITEINSYQGLKQLIISHPTNDSSGYNYDSLLKHGNKIWRNKTMDGDGCLYVINSEKQSDIDTVTTNAEEVLVELNDCGIVERSSTSPITVNTANLNAWFGNFFTIGTFEAPIGKNTVIWTGTITRMTLLRLIEEETKNIFVTRYEKDESNNIIHRYLDFKQSIGVEHTVPIEVGENTDKIELSINEDDTYRSIVPIIKGTDEGGATSDGMKISTILTNFKDMTINVGQSIPMIIEKKEDGTETVVANWNAPFRKDAGSFQVYLTPEEITSSYNSIHYKEGSSSYARKMGTVETSETNKYVIYNLCALKLMDKKDSVVEIEAEVHDLQELPGGNIPYNVGDTVYVRLPGRDIITSRVDKTEKDPRILGGSKITIGNAVSGTTSRSDLNRPAGLDSITLSNIYSQISSVSGSISGTADSRINTLVPGIADIRANGRINALVPGMISNAAEILGRGSFTIPSVTANTNGTYDFTVPAGTSVGKIFLMCRGGAPGVLSVQSLTGTTATVAYRYFSTATNRPVAWVVFK